jgi:transposase-like protein
MEKHHEAPDGASPDVRPKCPYCESTTIRIMTVPWYRELEYFTCEACKRTWTAERKRSWTR